MILPSNRYNSLLDRVYEIESNLLDFIDPSKTSYTDKEEDLTRSYCLLCHAEIESYLEDYTLEIAKKAFDEWERDKTIISPIIFHLTYHYSHELTKKEPPYSIVCLAYQKLIGLIKKNNGLKEANLKSFLQPIGFEMDNVLLTDLTDFGKNRGEIAHTSFRTQQQLDAVTERNRIKGIINALKTFDTDLGEYQKNGNWKNKPVNIMWENYSFWRRLKYLLWGE